MKKKFNLYCLMFILSVAFGITIDFVTGFTDFKNGFMEGWRSADEEWGKVAPYEYDNAIVTFRPKSLYLDNVIGKDSIYNEITNEKEAMNYNRIVVQVPKDKASSTTFSNTLLGLGSTLYAVGILGFWVIFFLAIRSVKHGDVFLQSVAAYLTKAAIFLFIVYIGEWMNTWAYYEHAKALVEIANYEIVPWYQYNNSNLFIAFGLMLLAQVIKYGKELKEERDLTI